MTKIGLISDTHGHWDADIEEFFAPCQQLWHAGDIGNLELADTIARFRPLVAVYGNIDGTDVRSEYPLEQTIVLEDATIYMRHIGGYPGHYAPGIASILRAGKPSIFIDGHSHILRIIYDRKFDLLFLNPGAYGHTGFHKVRTALRFDLQEGKPSNMEILQLPR
ncbi:MAG: metallophosphoesterase family protein [Bacteroides sp.]